jgi:hypothetical protein
MVWSAALRLRPTRTGPPEKVTTRVIRRSSVVQKFALLAALGVAIWLPRGLALDRFVTVDEPSWLTFSANFFQALARADFAHTFQIAHPGVTTTWIGTAALLWRYPTYAGDVTRQLNWVEEEVGALMRRHGHDPVDVLATARRLVVLTITIILVIAAAAAVPLIGMPATLVGFLLIASDPFHVALSRLLHVDALLSCLMLLSLLSFLNYMYRGRRRRDLLISGITAGLAWLTKAPAIFLVASVVALLLVDLAGQWRKHRRLNGDAVRASAWSLVFWGGSGLLVFTLLWPAMWVHPLTSVGTIAHEVLGMSRSGHIEAPLFFNGSIVQGDPGVSFYPITYLWRTTPVILIGLVLAIVTLPTPHWTGSHRRAASVLVVFAVLFAVMMTFGAKKFDRYLLPAYAPLDLVAAMGWLAAGSLLKANGWLQRRSVGLARLTGAAILALAVVGQFSAAAPAFPYYLSYYNPLLGGTPRASGVMMIGWGEGLDQAARYLNTKPHAERLRVSTWFWNGTFSYFFNGESIPGRFTPDSAGRTQWLTSDYCVVYINQRQRGRLPDGLLKYLDSIPPVKVVRIQGIEYARIYDIRDAPVPASLKSELARSATGEAETSTANSIPPAGSIYPRLPPPMVYQEGTDRWWSVR